MSTALLVRLPMNVQSLVSYRLLEKHGCTKIRYKICKYSSISMKNVVASNGKKVVTSLNTKHTLEM